MTMLPTWRACAIGWMGALILVVAFATPASAEKPHRTDHGDLVVLDVYGSYREMGRQAAELLGEDARRVLELNLDFYRRSQGTGVGAWLYDRVLLPTAVYFMTDDTGVVEEARGYAEALGIPLSDFMRAQIGAGVAGGSTLFASRGSATRDGSIILGRNVDWIDFGGRLVPTVIRYHPDGDDLDYISAAWPLLQIPTVGLNEAGLAFSLNYFATEPQMEPTSSSYPYRRVLQRARNVEQAIALFEAEFPIALSCFGFVADAEGEMALLECTTQRCEVFRPERDYLVQANHARTRAMISEDLFRGEDSFDRHRLMLAAVQARLGKIDAEGAAEILRNRKGHRHPNASVVGNLFVLNAAVIDPARRVLWHSDLQQPFAPFGRYVPIAIGAGERDGTQLEPIPASPVLATEGHRREADSIERVRAALDAQWIERDFGRANALWTEIFSDPPYPLDLSLLAIVWARSLILEQRFDEAAGVLDEWVADGVRREARVDTALLRGVIADAAGERDEAKSHFAAAVGLIDAEPDQNDLDATRALAVEGQAHPLALDELGGSFWSAGVPP